MKTTRSPKTKVSKQELVHTPRPEIRDNLDSRKNEEQDLKGDDRTHNKKEQRSAKPKRK
ncbi:hypothetical protein ACWKWU_11000 [Chitinophaga lutea]